MLSCKRMPAAQADRACFTGGVWPAAWSLAGLTCLGLLAGLACGLPAAQASPTQTPEWVFGAYIHLSRVCGGPGAADGPATCGLVREDKLTIGPDIRLGAEAGGGAWVSFGLHDEQMDYCGFDGPAAWVGDTLVMDRGDAPPGSKCRLAIAFPSRSSARLVDSGHQCHASLCGPAMGKRLHGAVFTRP
jgi:hypothetical protein